ncbi:hypothetical protein HPB49_020951 [Dermacentor silvarum]|uniref:Uncharacterized protein n=1 Tax=Dermacentor silvarum TaxID=543639 RepID=A0ACB8CMT7_DERSI|nr:hypothetical protein HPB49_020951 [Dermacentor silvarum]
MSKPVPNFMSIHGHRVMMEYRGMRRVCARCGDDGHMATACTSPYCKRCGVFGHDTDGCIEECKRCGGHHGTKECFRKKSYLAAARGPPSTNPPAFSSENTRAKALQKLEPPKPNYQVLKPNMTKPCPLTSPSGSSGDTTENEGCSAKSRPTTEVKSTDTTTVESELTKSSEIDTDLKGEASSSSLSPPEHLLQAEQAEDSIPPSETDAELNSSASGGQQPGSACSLLSTPTDAGDKSTQGPSTLKELGDKPLQGFEPTSISPTYLKPRGNPDLDGPSEDHPKKTKDRRRSRSNRRARERKQSLARDCTSQRERDDSQPRHSKPETGTDSDVTGRKNSKKPRKQSPIPTEPSSSSDGDMQE